MDFIQRYLLFILFFVLIAGYNQYTDDGGLIGSQSYETTVEYSDFSFIDDIPDVDDLDLETRTRGIDAESYQLIMTYTPPHSKDGKNIMIKARSMGDDLSDIEIFETGSLSGPIVDQSGHPLVDVAVKLVGLPTTTYTDYRGHFVLDDVPTGKHYVQLSKNGYISNRLAVVSMMSPKAQSVGSISF